MADLPRSGRAVRDLELPLPPAPMPLVRAGRPLKRWRYVGVYGPELMLCAADVRIGPLRQQWWAAAMPDGGILGRTALRSAGVTMDGTRVRVASRGARVELEVGESPGREVVQPSGSRGYVWTRKQAGVPARGFAELDGRRFEIDGEAVVDETAGYHERHTTWRWSAGVGRGAAGERLAWNLVSGVNDSTSDSERAVWVDGTEVEPAPVTFSPDLSRIAFADGAELRFSEWAAREERTNLLLVRSSYRQPFGTFEGELPGGVRVAHAYGVVEWHDVHW